MPLSLPTPVPSQWSGRRRCVLAVAASLEMAASLDGPSKSPRGLTGEPSGTTRFPRREFRGRHGGE
eukprot:1852111-Pyramimonas_sp.AAC.1